MWLGPWGLGRVTAGGPVVCQVRTHPREEESRSTRAQSPGLRLWSPADATRNLAAPSPIPARGGKNRLQALASPASPHPSTLALVFLCPDHKTGHHQNR